MSMASSLFGDTTVHLLWISLTPKQLEAINNPLCYITDQINVTEVELSVPFIFFFLAVYYF